MVNSLIENNLKNRPIGIFDSGIGGLTVVKEMIKLLPGEDIIYFGDTGRVPYGTRDNETVIKYASQDINFLMSHDVKMIIAACGTASAVFPASIYGEYGIPYSGVVVPAAEAACAATKNGKVGVIGTQATIRNQAYVNEVKKIDSSIDIMGAACPLLVPLVENGYLSNECQITRLALTEYLTPLKNKNIDTLILGCTHYPLLKDVISDIMGSSMVLIDAGEETALHVADLLKEKDLLKKSSGYGTLQFFVSDNPDSFLAGAEIFLGQKIKTEVKRMELG